MNYQQATSAATNNRRDVKAIKTFAGLLLVFVLFTAEDCDGGRPANTTAKDEQARTEVNQRVLLTNQPPPTISWSLERDNLRKRIKLMNDRSVMFYMYLFIEGQSKPIGYFQINKVSSVDSQLTNTQQLVKGDMGKYYGDFVLPSPSEDGSYGTNGDAIFGFTPEDIYVETNLKYFVSTIPMPFPDVTRLAIITNDEARQLIEKSKKVMNSK